MNGIQGFLSLFLLMSSINILFLLPSYIVSVRTLGLA